MNWVMCPNVHPGNSPSKLQDITFFFKKKGNIENKEIKKKKKGENETCLCSLRGQTKDLNSKISSQTKALVNVHQNLSGKASNAWPPQEPHLAS